MRVSVLLLIACLSMTMLASAVGAVDKPKKPAPSPTVVAATQAPDPALVVKTAENYFSTLDTVKARFVQTAPDGTQRIGVFYMDRPGKMRFEYDAPVRDLVVADGIQLYYYDGDLKQVSSAPVGQTLADFLLRKNIKLSGDVRVVGVQDGGGLTQIILAQTADPNAGTMTLGFRADPYGLKKWRVVDGQGQTTEVELFDIQEGLALPNSLFVFRDPDHPKGKYND
jgi:outer membrane lipoprotein-sorting protein